MTRTSGDYRCVLLMGVTLQIINAANELLCESTDKSGLTKIVRGYLDLLKIVPSEQPVQADIREAIMYGFQQVNRARLDDEPLWSMIVEIIQFHTLQANEPSVAVQLAAQNALIHIN